MFNINFANDWNQTADLWRWKQLLYQLRQNNCPIEQYFYSRNLISFNSIHFGS